MARSELRDLRRLVGPSCVAGVLPLCLVFGADAVFGPWTDDTDYVYYAQAIVGPPLIALLFVPHFGRRAAWVAAGGVIVAMLLMLTLFIGLAALMSAGES